MSVVLKPVIQLFGHAWLVGNLLGQLLSELLLELSPLTYHKLYCTFKPRYHADLACTFSNTINHKYYFFKSPLVETTMFDSEVLYTLAT